VNKTYRVGSRGSALAMHQTRQIIQAMEARNPQARFEVVEIATTGDQFPDTPISQMGDVVDRGIFNTALVQAVLAGRVDMATCSFKDVESDLPKGLEATTVLPREDVRDVLASRHRTGLAGLPQGAVLATSSPRRVSQLLAYRPDLKFQPLRGNITTRVTRDVERFDGVVLAAAGVARLSLQQNVTEWISEDILLPAAAQGALGCEYLADNLDAAKLVASITHPETELCAKAEKSFLVDMSGGCYAPIGIWAQALAGRLSMRCRIVSLDGRRKVEERAEGSVSDPAQVVRELAAKARAKGGAEIVRETREAILDNRPMAPGKK